MAVKGVTAGLLRVFATCSFVAVMALSWLVKDTLPPANKKQTPYKPQSITGRPVLILIS